MQNAYASLAMWNMPQGTKGSKSFISSLLMATGMVAGILSLLKSMTKQGNSTDAYVMLSMHPVVALSELKTIKF